MIRYFNLANKTDNNYSVDGTIDESYMVAIPYDGKPYGLVDGKVICLLNTPEYIDEQAENRREIFEANFFLITGFGWYRKVPKGYSSAIESFNTVFNAVSVLGQLPANYIDFYTAPDFYNELECTEAWLVEHSRKNEAMTVEQFALFYKTAITIWNSQEH